MIYKGKKLKTAILLLLCVFLLFAVSACVDLVYEAPDGQDLVARIESLNGQHTLDYGQKIGLGSKKYTLVDLGD